MERVLADGGRRAVHVKRGRVSLLPSAHPPMASGQLGQSQNGGKIRLWNKMGRERPLPFPGFNDVILNRHVDEVGVRAKVQGNVG